MPNLLGMMSRFFKADSVSGQPAYGSPGYDGAHMFLNAEAGNLLRNIGTNQYSMHTDEWSNRFALFERFLQLPKLNAVQDVGSSFASAELQASFDANRNFEVLGTNMTSALSTFATGGGAKLTTAGASADQAILRPHLNTASTAWASQWLTQLNISFDCIIKTSGTISSEAATSNSTIWAGFKTTNTSVTITDDDQAFFRMSSATEATSGSPAAGTTGVHTPAVWECIDSSTVSAVVYDNIQATTVAFAVDTHYWLRVVVDGNLIPRYYINGALVATGKALKTAVALVPFIGVSASAAKAKAIIVRGIACGMTYNPATAA